MFFRGLDKCLNGFLGASMYACIHVHLIPKIRIAMHSANNLTRGVHIQ